MKEKIVEIKEVFSVKRSKDDWCSMDGYEVITDKQTISLLISNSQSCCEDWGYFMSDDDIKSFIGADLIDISLTDTALNEKDLDDVYLDSGDIMFVDFKTSEGVFQFVAYNGHNGYYGHDACVISKQLNHEENL